jgi:ribosomal protein S18 acetylase RimI-like enzyme
MDEQIRRLDINHFDEALRVHSEAFRNDLPLLRILHYRAEDLYLMHKNMDRLLLNDERVYVYGCFREDRLACIAFCADSKWRPKIRQAFELGISMLRVLGPIKTYRALKFNILLSIKSRPVEEPCIRVMAIGTDDSVRGQGLGTEMIRFLREEFRRQGRRLIQLEVEGVNLAKKLYLREGYEVRKNFEVDGVDWSVMILPLD